MEFQISPDVAELFADATAAYIRSKADTVSLAERDEDWHTLWVTFRDADNASLTVPNGSVDLMWRVWAAPNVWRDEQTRQYVKSQLRPQWREQRISQITRYIEAF